MSILRNLMSGLQTLFHKKEVEQEMDEELRGYLDAAVKAKMRSGMSQEQALRAARVEMGSMDAVKEEIRSVGWEAAVETFWQDVRYSLRQLKRNPGFTAVAVITLALGIGATTAIFTVVNAVLLRPLPYPHPEELVYVQEILGNYGLNPFVWNKEFAAWRNQSRTLSPIAAYRDFMANLTGGGEPERIICGMATTSFFSLLGVRPVVGRLFLPEEDRPGGAPVVILSEALWKNRYRGDPSVLGRGLTLDGKVYTVVGVLPATFVIPDEFKIPYALWVPVAESETGAGPFRSLRAIGRLKPGVSLAKAQAELDTIMQAYLAKGHPKERRPVTLAGADRPGFAAFFAALLGRGWLSAPHRLRQRRESASRPRGQPSKRNCGAADGGRREDSGRPAASHGELAAGFAGRASRSGIGVLGEGPSDCFHFSEPSVAGTYRPRLPGPGV